MRFAGILTGFLLLFVAAAGYAMEPMEAQKTPTEASLKNGFYLILEEQADAAMLQKPAENEVVVTYTLDHLGVKDQPPRHYRVKNLPDVGFSLDSRPEIGDKVDGKTTLNVILCEGDAQAFQKFTATNIGRALAIIIGGKVVTAHKIRTEIVGGKIQITRCGDDACEQLFMWLKDSVAR